MRSKDRKSHGHALQAARPQAVIEALQMCGLPTRIDGYGRRAEDARSKAENTRFGATKTSWLQLARLWDELADHFNLSRQLQRPMRLEKTPQQSSSEKLTETRMIRARTGLLFLLDELT